ncbi:MAG: YihY/virulence factor BrkB family protein [Anaerolineales bacterium]|jgi:membrane protein
MKQKFSIFVKGIYQIWIGERPSQLGAGLAYYSMFSAAPVIYIAISIGGIFLDELALAERFYSKISRVMGQETAAFLEQMVESVAIDPSSGNHLTMIISFVALLLAASSIFFYLQYTLNVIWKATPPKRDATISMLRNKMITFVLVIGVGLLLVVAASMNIILSLITNFFDIGNWGIINFAAMIALGSVAFAIIFKVLPNTEIAWGDVWVGALVTALLIAVGGWGLGIYLANSTITSAFEAAGAMAVFLISVFFFAQLFLFGAVFTRVYSTVFGSNIPKQVDVSKYPD